MKFWRVTTMANAWKCSCHQGTNDSCHQPTWDVPECTSNSVVGFKHHQGTQPLDAPAVPHFTLASTQPTGLVHLCVCKICFHLSLSRTRLNSFCKFLTLSVQSSPTLRKSHAQRYASVYARSMCTKFHSSVQREDGVWLLERSIVQCYQQWCGLVILCSLDWHATGTYNLNYPTIKGSIPPISGQGQLLYTTTEDPIFRPPKRFPCKGKHIMKPRHLNNDPGHHSSGSWSFPPEICVIPHMQYVQVLHISSLSEPNNKVTNTVTEVITTQLK